MADREVKELEEAIEQIWEIATVKFGLDPFPVRFEIVPASVMYEVGSYALPGRYSNTSGWPSSGSSARASGRAPASAEPPAM